MVNGCSLGYSNLFQEPTCEQAAILIELGYRLNPIHSFLIILIAIPERSEQGSEPSEWLACKHWAK